MNTGCRQAPCEPFLALPSFRVVGLWKLRTFLGAGSSALSHVTGSVSRHYVTCFTVFFHFLTLNIQIQNRCCICGLIMIFSANTVEVHDIAVMALAEYALKAFWNYWSMTIMFSISGSAIQKWISCHHLSTVLADRLSITRSTLG